jgi:hypothetical protein
MKKLLILSLSILIPATQLFGAFTDSGWGVRPMGMGGAFTAVANDSNANIYNPAGIAQLQDKEVSFMSSKLFTGLEGVDLGQNFLSYVHPVSDSFGSLGFSWQSMYSQNLYREDTVAFSYGRYFDDILKLKTFDILGGASLKYLNHGYTTDVRSAGDPVFAGGTIKGAPTADVGFLTIFPDSGISLGLALRNITSPDVGLQNSDIVPMETALGVSYYKDKMPYVCLPSCTVALDLVGRDNKLDCRFGIETWLLKGNLCVRSGVNPEEFAFGLGHELTIFGKTRLEIDYAFTLPLQVEESTGSHRLGLTLRFP